MDLRLDPTTVLAETVLELERLATRPGSGTVGTVGEIEVDPGLINADRARTCGSRSTSAARRTSASTSVAREIAAFAERAGGAPRHDAPSYEQRQTLPATPLDGRIVGALETAAAAAGEP